MQNTINQNFITRLKLKAQLQLNEVNSRLFNLPQEILKRNSADGGWSIARCLAHLNTYSDHYLPLIQNSVAIKCNNPVKPFKSGWLGGYFIGMMNPLNKSKYKAAAKHIPPVTPDVYQELTKFVSNNEKLIELLDQAENVDLNNLRIKTSISNIIRLSLGDTLEFILVHNDRHIQQALNQCLNVDASFVG